MDQSCEELEMVVLNGSCVQKVGTESSDEEKGDSVGLHCIGYRTAKDKVALFMLLSVLSSGLLLLLSYWKPHWRLKLTSRKAHRGSETHWVLLKYEDGSIFVEKVIPVSSDSQEDFVVKTEKSFRMKTGQSSQRKGCDESAQPLLCSETSDWEEKGEGREEGKVQYFVHRYQRFQYNPLTERAVPMTGLVKQTCESLCESKGLTDEEVLERREMYGENLAAVEVTPYLQLFFSEVLNPFYVFQWVTVIFWCLDEYYYYSGAILFISFLSLGISLYQTRMQLEELRRIAPKPVQLTVRRNGGGHMTVASGELVPGDLVEIPAQMNFEMPCDAVLICGTCRVNESMLTGESTTVTKTELCPSESEEEEECGEVTDFSDEEETSGSHPVDSATLFESGGALTGSVLYDADSPSCKVHTLCCGTTIVGTQPRDGCVLAVVVKTGFSTEKGKLLRSILFPCRVKFRFYRDAFRFVGILCIVAAIGFAYSCVLFVEYNDGIKELLFRAVDLITTVVPPGLPAAMTVGTIYAVRRLKQHKICCTSPPRVNVSGKINLVCFDKTGTLTEDNMKMKVVVSYDTQSSQIWKRIKAKNFPPRCDLNKQLLIGMATCHELSDSKSGPAEDIAMFDQTGWILTDRNVVRPQPSIGSNSGEQEQYTILSQNPFESGLKRMSVLVHAVSKSRSEHLAFAKGAPEVIHGLCRGPCRPSEDILKQELSHWTKQGCRVLAIAYKRVKAESAGRINRAQVERDLKFLGLLVMTSDLKEMTEPVINELQAAKIRIVMVTGDYMDTAVSVAKQCGIVLPEDRLVCVEPAPGVKDVEYRTVASRKQRDINHYNGCITSTVADLWNDSETLQPVFAMTGESLRRIRNQCRTVDSLMSRNKAGVTELDKALVHGVVFARMGPDEKKQLVEDLQGLGYCVCMCGDGANDCKALRAADAGISLSKAEASVAAPFTSQVADVSCVPTLIREGRTSLVTTFSVFKYMATYSIIEFTTVLMLYTLNSNFGDWQYFYIDLVIVLVLSFVGESTKPSKGILATKSPLCSLITFPVLCSLLSQIAVQILLLSLTYKYMQSEPWFVPLVQVNNTENVKCFENTVLFCLCSFLMINIAVAFATGPPHRSPMYTNRLFVASVIVLYVFTAYITLWPADFLVRKFKLDVPSSLMFRVAVIEIAMLGLVVSSLLDHFIVSSNAMKQLHRRISMKPKPKYEEVQMSMGGG